MDKLTDSIHASTVCAWYVPNDRKLGTDTSKFMRVYCGVQTNGRKFLHRVDGHSAYADDVLLTIGRTTIVSDESIEKGYTRVDPPEWSKPKLAKVEPPKEPTMADVLAEVVALRKEVESLKVDNRGQLSLLR